MPTVSVSYITSRVNPTSTHLHAHITHSTTECLKVIGGRQFTEWTEKAETRKAEFLAAGKAHKPIF